MLFHFLVANRMRGKESYSHRSATSWKWGWLDGRRVLVICNAWEVIAKNQSLTALHDYLPMRGLYLAAEMLIFSKIFQYISKLNQYLLFTAFPVIEIIL